MIKAAQGSRLASIRPANTADHLALTATIDTEVKRLFVTNTSSSPRTFRLYHVPASGVVGLDSALYYDRQIAGNDAFMFSCRAANNGIQLKPGDRLYVRSSNANDLAFNVYGVTANVA